MDPLTRLISFDPLCYGLAFCLFPVVFGDHPFTVTVTGTGAHFSMNDAEHLALSLQNLSVALEVQGLRRGDNQLRCRETDWLAAEGGGPLRLVREMTQNSCCAPLSV